MKQYTHAWLAFMAIKRLEKSNTPEALSLVRWFNNHRDFVLQGAWYPDAIIKDMATSHVLKYKPDDSSTQGKFRKLPNEYKIYEIGKASPQYGKGYTIVGGNLPDRCEALAHSIVDNLKMLESEEKGSPISPTGNHIATLFFILSHYVADAHMPLHCDARGFSKNDNIHEQIEGAWDDIIQKCYSIDKVNKRFVYDSKNYPLKKECADMVDWLEEEIANRSFCTTYGEKNENTWDFMSAITQYSYLTSYKMIPADYDESNLDWNTFKDLNTGISLAEYSKYILVDSIDSIARIWLRVWNRYQDWLVKKNASIAASVNEPA